MLEQVLEHINNWFAVSELKGDFRIVGGSLELPLKEGQYFRIEGSVFNDGLHRFPAYDLEDEEFHGSVYGLAIPKAVRALSEDVSKWCESNQEAARSPYSSESFGGYSYTLKGANNGSDGASGWQTAFKAELNRWRRI